MLRLARIRYRLRCSLLNRVLRRLVSEAARAESAKTSSVFVMGTRDGAWTGVRYRGSGFLFWVRLAIKIVRINRNRTDHIGSHFLVK